MAVCDTCGNDYDKAFQVTKGGKTMTFDNWLDKHEREAEEHEEALCELQALETSISARNRELRGSES